MMGVPCFGCRPGVVNEREIRMRHSKTLGGRVVDDLGSPVVGAIVRTASHPRTDYGSAADVVRTDAAGRFAVETDDWVVQDLVITSAGRPDQRIHRLTPEDDGLTIALSRTLELITLRVTCSEANLEWGGYALAYRANGERGRRSRVGLQHPTSGDGPQEATLRLGPGEWSVDVLTSILRY